MGLPPLARWVGWPEEVRAREIAYPEALRINLLDPEWALALYDLFDAMNLPPGVEALREMVERASKREPPQVTDFQVLLEEVETCQIEILEEAYEKEGLLREVRELRVLVKKLREFEMLRAELIYTREAESQQRRINAKLREELTKLRSLVEELEW